MRSYILCAVAIVLAANASVSADGGSKLYYKWLKGCLKAIGGDVPSVTASAEVAARRWVTGACEIGAWGDTAFVNEFTGRAGGIMPTAAISADHTSNAIVLMTLREDHLEADLKQASEFQKRGNYVVIFARKALAKMMRPSPNISLIDTHAAEHGGLIAVDGKWLVPTNPTANIAALWVWTGEFVGACTRLGSAPPMWQSVMVLGSKERNARFAGVRFLDKCPPPVPAGKIAREYLKALGKNLDDVFAASSATMDNAALAASNVRAGGGNLYAAFMGHALQVQLGCAEDPGFFKPAADANIKRGDFVISVGYDRILKGPQWGNLAEKARAAGAGILWSFTSYNRDEAKSIQPGELYIDQLSALGDAAVTVPGYDVRILPPSGVIGEAIFWSINAEMLQQR